MNYVIIRASTSLVELQEKVNAMVRAGWIPAGGPFRNLDTAEWCQAMTGQESKDVRLKEPVLKKP